MLNLGDITLINGSECPSVDVVIGGSPCQNLSIAGTREGLQGNESSLFLHQIRIVKEMREHAHDEAVQKWAEEFHQNTAHTVTHILRLVAVFARKPKYASGTRRRQ